MQIYPVIPVVKFPRDVYKQSNPCNDNKINVFSFSLIKGTIKISTLPQTIRVLI